MSGAAGTRFYSQWTSQLDLLICHSRAAWRIHAIRWLTWPNTPNHKLASPAMAINQLSTG
jgi:hypothetical protein